MLETSMIERNADLRKKALLLLKEKPFFAFNEEIYLDSLRHFNGFKLRLASS